MFNSLGLIGVAILFAFVGIVVAAIWTFFLGFAGVPGALLTTYFSERRPSGVGFATGIVLTILGHLAVALIFVVLIAELTKTLIGGTTGIGKWLLVLVSWLIASAPPWMALKDAVAKRTETAYEDLQPGLKAQLSAPAFVAPISSLAFIVYYALR